MLIAASSFADTKWAVWFTDTVDPLDSSLKMSLVVADELSFEDGFVRLGGTIKYLRRASNVDLEKILKNAQKFENRAKFISKDDFFLTKNRIYVVKKYDSKTVSSERRKAEAEAAEKALENAEASEVAEVSDVAAAIEKTESAVSSENPENAEPSENAAAPENIENTEPSENAEAVEAEPVVEEVKSKKAKKERPAKVKKPKKVKAAPEPEPEPEPEVVESPVEAEETLENPELENTEAETAEAKAE